MLELSSTTATFGTLAEVKNCFSRIHGSICFQTPCHWPQQKCWKDMNTIKKKTKVFTVLLKTIQHRMLNSDWDQVPGKHRFSPQWLWDFFMWDHGKAINCQVGIGLWVGEKVRSQNLQVHLILRNQCWNCWKSKPFMKENCPLLILIVQGSIIQV
jgi:hypothetical protein